MEGTFSVPVNFLEGVEPHADMPSFRLFRVGILIYDVRGEKSNVLPVSLCVHVLRECGLLGCFLLVSLHLQDIRNSQQSLYWESLILKTFIRVLSCRDTVQTKMWHTCWCVVTCNRGYCKWCDLVIIDQCSCLIFRPVNISQTTGSFTSCTMHYPRVQTLRGSCNKLNDGNLANQFFFHIAQTGNEKRIMTGPRFSDAQQEFSAQFSGKTKKIGS